MSYGPGVDVYAACQGESSSLEDLYASQTKKAIDELPSDSLKKEYKKLFGRLPKKKKLTDEQMRRAVLTYAKRAINIVFGAKPAKP